MSTVRNVDLVAGFGVVSAVLGLASCLQMNKGRFVKSPKRHLVIWDVVAKVVMIIRNIVTLILVTSIIVAEDRYTKGLTALRISYGLFCIPFVIEGLLACLTLKVLRTSRVALIMNKTLMCLISILGCLSLIFGVALWKNPELYTLISIILALVVLIVCVFTQYSTIKKVADIKLEMMSVNSGNSTPHDSSARNSDRLIGKLAGIGRLLSGRIPIGSSEWIEQTIRATRIGIVISSCLILLVVILVILSTTTQGYSHPYENILTPLEFMIIGFSKRQTVEMSRKSATGGAKHTGNSAKGVPSAPVKSDAQIKASAST